MGKTTSAKRISRRKSTLTGRDNRRTFRRAVSKNHATAVAQVIAELGTLFVLKSLFPQKLPYVSLTNPASTVGSTAITLLEVMLKCVNDGVTTIKPGHQTSGNA
jgi:hypothetical protein